MDVLFDKMTGMVFSLKEFLSYDSDTPKFEL